MGRVVEGCDISAGIGLLDYVYVIKLKDFSVLLFRTWTITKNETVAFLLSTSASY